MAARGDCVMFVDVLEGKRAVSEVLSEGAGERGGEWANSENRNQPWKERK